jgi:hypothetical protein
MVSMLAPHDLGRLQREQFLHDRRNHADIHCLHKSDRLKHYGLHFAKYVGRLARGENEPKTVHRTLVDTILVSLSAANTLHQNLEKEDFSRPPTINDPLRTFADAAGRFADACEKSDHLEDFTTIARRANADIMRFVISMTDEHSVELTREIKKRREELAARQFYITD